ncbi:MULTISPECIES: TolC family outer membrane protein [unclassified Sphingomonas]|uniref:TolC family outer membrane protein n=1 Tax=unclassified Sphingomonas TaxID=196159 RepID=UPI00226A7774|nr:MULTISPECIES: TolC family outer membrane protein [unclassified Sphingomonas]
MNRRWLLAGSMLLAPPAAGETLADAVRAAVATNPSLAAAQARQDALAEAPEQARAQGRLTGEAGALGGYDRFNGGKGATGTVSATLPIWTGGRVRTAVRAADADVAAGAQGLRDVAAGVLSNVVAAYADLLFQQESAAIVDADIQLLDNQVAEAKARFDLGTGTQTDVSRLVAQRATASATQASAQAALAAAAATYRAVVGRDPGQLAPPPATLAGLPPTIEQARARAVEANPLYRQAQATQAAAAARIGVARSNGAPSLGLGASYGYGVAIGHDGGGYVSDTAAGLTFRLPLLTGGLVQSQVREATANARAARYDVDAASRDVIRQTDTAWANVVAARARVEANTKAAAAADRALAGVKAEYAVGLRTTLDILIADESLRGAQLALASARSDLLTGEAGLLRAMGTLELASVG